MEPVTAANLKAYLRRLGQVLANRMLCAPDYQRGDGLIGSERRTPRRFAGIERWVL